ncbi:hypothetical protein F0562_006046 [Nyssa sinensis]|uniref:Uncharacterized protein n=1 Tax=Nyssa sinensis TaxID=561372 RepID=A0A5J5APK6_9ASTE|nr:hypothetical protein F0562_006046 [Nyssa sinensis]
MASITTSGNSLGSIKSVLSSHGSVLPVVFSPNSGKREDISNDVLIPSGIDIIKNTSQVSEEGDMAVGLLHEDCTFANKTSNSCESKCVGLAEGSTAVPIMKATNAAPFEENRGLAQLWVDGVDRAKDKIDHPTVGDSSVNLGDISKPALVRSSEIQKWNTVLNSNSHKGFSLDYIAPFTINGNVIVKPP